MGFLQGIQHLLFDLLQLVLHLDDDVLHLCLVALRAGRIDFAPHLLGNEAELLADTVSALTHGLPEILEVVGEPLLFLADVEFPDGSCRIPLPESASGLR